MFSRLWALAATKFLSNFNDNAFKTVGMFVAMEAFTGDAGAQFAVVAIGSIVFMLPFVTFPTVAGWLCDRLPKRTVLIAAKVAELGIMLGGMIALAMADSFGLVPLFVAVFLMALQSTFLSPAFLGVLPEVFDERQLSKANGIFDLLGFLGIILGCGAGGVLKQYTTSGSLLLGVPMVILAALGIVTALGIPRTSAPLSGEAFTVQVITRYFREMRLIAVSRPILLCVLGNAMFMAVGTLILTSLMSFGVQVLGLPEAKVAGLQVAAALGIGVGCFVAGSFSHEKVEFGLVPIGCWGMTVFFFNLCLTTTLLFGVINVFMIGLFGGFFVLPLIVYIQERTPANVRGRTMAQTNSIAFWGALLASIAMLLLTGGMTGSLPADADFWTRVRHNVFFTLGPRELYLCTAIFLLASSTYVFWLLPEFLLRLLVILLTRFCYRIQVYGRHHLPKRGPALLVANHVSLIDGLLITATSSRDLYFVVSERLASHRLVRPFARWARLIALPDGNSPKRLQTALEQIRELLRQGAAICVFPEGEPTPNGIMQQFRRGFLKMLPEDVEVPVIPVHLGLVWGSIFSKRFGKQGLRAPKSFPYPVIIAFGKPLPPDSGPFQARMAIAELAAETESHPSPGERVLVEQFIHQARRHPFFPIMQDSGGTALTYGAALVRIWALADYLKRTAPAEEKYIGIMLPPCTSAAVFCMAVMLTDRIPIFLNFTASHQAIDFAVDKCDIRRIFTSKAFIAKAKLTPREDLVYLEDVAGGMGTPEKLRAALRTVLLPTAVARRTWYPHTARTVHNTATILFSSGSTGLPKGVILSHHNFTANINGTMRVLGVERHDRLLGSLPFFHSFGFLATLWLPLSRGIPVVYHLNPMDAAGIGELVEREKLSILFATPTFLQAYTRRCTPEQFATLRMVITGADKLRQGTADRFAERFGVVPIEGYGTTELSPVVSVNVPEDFHRIGQDIGRRGAVGKPLPGIAVRIAAMGDGSALGEDCEGVLWVKGPNVMAGYLDAPEQTARVLHDGWYDTGDIAKLDADGYLYITGRVSRFSKVGGEMVPHIALEEEIHHVLGANDVLVAVTAVPDEQRGERVVVLHLKLAMSPVAVIEGLRQRGLPNLWLPKPSDFVEVESIPQLGSGKLDLGSIKQTASRLMQDR